MDMDFDQLYYTIQKCDNNGVKCEPDIQALDNSSSRIIPWESTPIDFYHIPFLVYSNFSLQGWLLPEGF